MGGEGGGRLKMWVACGVDDRGVVTGPVTGLRVLSRAGLSRQLERGVCALGGGVGAHHPEPVCERGGRQSENGRRGQRGDALHKLQPSPSEYMLSTHPATRTPARTPAHKRRGGPCPVQYRLHSLGTVVTA